MNRRTDFILSMVIRSSFLVTIFFIGVITVVRVDKWWATVIAMIICSLNLVAFVNGTLHDAAVTVLPEYLKGDKK